MAEHQLKVTKYVAEVRTDINQATRIAGIKTDNYSSSWKQLQELVAIAKADFPDLSDENIHTVAYDGDRWKRQTGIEFDIPVDSCAPFDYHECPRLEYVFAGN